MSLAHTTIDGIILAAGQSRRMGRPKAALMGPDGMTFLERAVQTLRAAACRRVLVVVNAVEPALSTAAGVELEVVINARAQSEQIDSLRLALERLDATTDAVLVLPVDLPLMAADTAAAVAASYRERAALIVIPSHDGVAGHPILLARALFDEILHGDWEHGIRSLLRTHEADARIVAVTDPGILVDIDTPDEYVRHVVRQ